MDCWFWHAYRCLLCYGCWTLGTIPGLSIAWQKGDCWLIVAIDGLCVIHLIANFLVLANEHTSLGRFVEELLKRDWNITINHMYCEANFAANFLGNYALSLPLVVIFSMILLLVCSFLSHMIYMICTRLFIPTLFYLNSR